MASGAVLSYRNDLEEKLKEKRQTLLATEETLKKYVGDVATRPSFRGRLGPLPQRENIQSRLSLDGQQRRPIAGRGRLSLEGRLGPKVNEEEDEADEGRKVTSVMSRVFVEQKSREEALKEKKADKAEVQRSKRMFGNLLGTLQRFRQDENKVKERELKKREIELKIDEKTEKEKDEAKKKKQELFTDLEKQRQQFRILQAQMKRVQEFEDWEKNKRFEAKFIRTKKSPNIYFLPKELKDTTMTALEETIDLVEEEIKSARIKFEEDIKKLMDTMENPAEEANFEEDEPEEDAKNLPSVVSAIQKPAQRKRSLSPKTRQPRNKSHSSESEEEKRESNNANNAKEEEPKEEIEEEQKHTEGETTRPETEEEKKSNIKDEKNQKGIESKVTEKRSTRSPEALSPKSDRKSTKPDHKKSQSRGQRKRSGSSSSESSSSDSSDSSDDQSGKKNGPAKKKARRGSSSD